MFEELPGYAERERLRPTVIGTVDLTADLAATAFAHVTAAFGG